ncbi:MAG: hypothetical protein IKE90_03180 [Bacilli bacterium]|nr:hypothetical protein [Bacilli bacterium]
MDNFTNSMKRFFRNKNTVTIIGVILILVLLYIGYSLQIKSAVRGVSIPVATTTIQPRTLITSEMVTTVTVPSIAVSKDVYANSGLVVGRYSNVNALIPKGSMFYKQSIINEEDLPDAAFVDLEEGQIAYSFPVDMESTYGNAIMPGSKVNIYMKYGNGADEKVMVGKLITNVKVLAVKDSSGRNVFEDSENTRTPSMMIFGLKEKLWLLLSKAYYLRGEGIELFPVPATGRASIDGATEVSTKELEDIINARSVEITSNETVSEDNLTPTVSETGGNPNTVTLTFPEGCGSTYVCKYKKDNGAEKNVKKTTISIKYNGPGTLVATVTESDGNVHTLNTTIPITSNSTNGQVG